MGEGIRDSRWQMLNDSISILMAAEQGEGIALSRWSLVARDIEAGRLVRAINTVVKADWSYYFVAPSHYFDLPKVAAFRDWLLDQFRQFQPPSPP
jgi:LysR family glycine cleavage system transcriptional activator